MSIWFGSMLRRSPYTHYFSDPELFVPTCLKGMSLCEQSGITKE